jgi:hypothetical protein
VGPAVGWPHGMTWWWGVAEQRSKGVRVAAVEAAGCSDAVGVPSRPWAMSEASGGGGEAVAEGGGGLRHIAATWWGVVMRRESQPWAVSEAGGGGGGDGPWLET